MVVKPSVVVIALTEDGKNPTKGGIVLDLVRALLVRVVSPGVQTQRIEWTVCPEEHRGVLAGNLWLADHTRHQRAQTALHRYLCDAIGSGELFTLVAHAFDADEPWHPAREPKRLVRWRERLLRPVRDLLGEDGELSGRLVPLVAHPEIEAWLYLHRERLEDLARADGQVAPRPPEGGWHTCTAVKDESHWPRDVHNARLAKGFPAERAMAESPSFAAAADRLREAPGLLEALQATRSA